MVIVSKTLMHVLCLNLFNTSVGEDDPRYRALNIESLDTDSTEGYILVKGFLSYQAKSDSKGLVLNSFAVRIKTV